MTLELDFITLEFDFISLELDFGIVSDQTKYCVTIHFIFLPLRIFVFFERGP